MVNGIPVKNVDVVWRDIEGEAILLDPRKGKYFGLNEVGCSFWKMADGKRSMEEIVSLLLEEYEVGRGTLLNDLNNLVHVLEDNGLLSIK